MDWKDIAVTILCLGGLNPLCQTGCASHSQPLRSSGSISGEEEGVQLDLGGGCSSSEDLEEDIRATLDNLCNGRPYQIKTMNPDAFECVDGWYGTQMTFICE